MRFWVATLAVLMGLGLTEARAEPAPRKPTNTTALDHFTRAARLFGNKEWDDAIEEFKASALSEPAPATDFNLGVCYRLLGDDLNDKVSEPTAIRSSYEASIWHYERFIKASPETPELAASVQVLIDEMRNKLEKLPQAAQPAEPARAVLSPVRTDARAEPFYLDGVAWGLAGAGLVSLGVSGGLLWSAASLRDEANNTAEQREQASLRERADTRAIVGTTLGIVGGGLLVGGVVKLIIHDRDVDGATVTVGVTHRGLWVAGRF